MGILDVDTENICSLANLLYIGIHMTDMALSLVTHMYRCCRYCNSVVGERFDAYGWKPFASQRSPITGRL